MTWDNEYLLDANGHRIGAVFPSGNLYTSAVYFRKTMYLDKTSTIGGAKEQLEQWWRDVQEVEL